MPDELFVANPKRSAPSKYRSFALPILAFDLLIIGLMMLRAIDRGKSPMRYFGEAGIISWLSFLQLLVLAILCFWIFRIRKRGISLKWKSPQSLWQWMAISFFFLAIDDIAQIHEKLDFAFHAVFQLQENPITDRLDDLIVLLYVIGGGYLLYLFRREFQYYRPAFKWIIGSFILAGIMILLDVGTNFDPESNIDAFKIFFADLESRRSLLLWLQAIEEGFKILSEGCFIAATIICLQIARRLNRQTPTRSV